MRTKAKPTLRWTLIALMIGSSSVLVPDCSAANRLAVNDPAAQEMPLTQTGQKLMSRYAGMLATSQAKISKALPKFNQRKLSAYSRACEAQKVASAELAAVQQRQEAVKTAKALVNHAKGKWIGGANKGIAKAQAKLKKAATKAERAAAQKELVKWQQNREEGIEALKQRQAALGKAQQEVANLLQNLDAAKKTLKQAQVKKRKAADQLKLKAFLASDKLDAQLAKYVVLLEAKPSRLAEFAQQSKRQEKLVDQLLDDADLMLQMVVADGANDGRYGRAMDIYTDIQQASGRARRGVLQRLALAISLEHAVPVSQRNAVALTDAPKTVNPVNRYLQFEEAFLNGELDPSFNGHGVWDLRMVVDGYEPDEILVWGRKMLRNYRPDHVSTPDYRWRYVAAVRTDVKYGSQDNQFDKPELQFFQNILMNGGVCGRRAFFGRFILRAFGIPTTARPQRGHAALAHWTPDGWVVCLGGGWGAGWTKTRYKKDLDFLASTQARATGKRYLQVKRAHWVGDAMGEPRTFGLLSGEPAFWNGIALDTQREIIENANAVALPPVGEDLAEANESKHKGVVKAITVTKADSKISVGPNGEITIPAVACSQPTNSTRKLIFMESNLGGMQLHYSRNGKAEAFEYAFDAPAAGEYRLTARVVTPSWNQHLLVTVNDHQRRIDIALPFTVGIWEQTQPVEVLLVKGRNVLRFSRDEPVKGLTIKDFTLTPLK